MKKGPQDKSKWTMTTKKGQDVSLSKEEVFQMIIVAVQSSSENNNKNNNKKNNQPEVFKRGW